MFFVLSFLMIVSTITAINFLSQLQRIKKTVAIFGSLFTLNEALLSQTVYGIDKNYEENAILRVNEKNFLMNPILEQYRKVTQMETDFDTTEQNKILALIPIINLKEDIIKIKDVLLQKKSIESLQIASNIISKPIYQISKLKTMFNRYADNIYYSDPNRANLYLNGGAVPSSLQTERYLQRNIVLTNIQYIQDDLRAILRIPNLKNDLLNEEIILNNNEYKETINNSLEDCDEAIASVNQYLNIADVNDVKLALQILQKEK